MKKLSGIAIINCEIGKKIAFTYSVVDDSGNITKSNNKESFVVMDESITQAIKIIEESIYNRIEE